MIKFELDSCEGTAEQLAEALRHIAFDIERGERRGEIRIGHGWSVGGLEPPTDAGWSGYPNPLDPDNAWIDDETGEAVCAHCSQRADTLPNIPHAADCGRPKESGK